MADLHDAASDAARMARHVLSLLPGDKRSFRALRKDAQTVIDRWDSSAPAACADCGHPDTDHGGPDFCDECGRDCRQPERAVADVGEPAGERGLYGKYIVHRRDLRDFPGERHHGCHYFVLDTTHDPHASAALWAYADSCEADSPALAADLRVIADGCLECSGYGSFPVRYAHGVESQNCESCGGTGAARPSAPPSGLEDGSV